MRIFGVREQIAFKRSIASRERSPDQPFGDRRVLSPYEWNSVSLLISCREPVTLEIAPSDPSVQLRALNIETLNVDTEELVAR